LAELHAEASCPICLDPLTDPVTIACGHNFCVGCIGQRWEGLEHILPCPVCLHHCPDRDFRRNTQLRHVTGLVRQLPGARSKRKVQDERPLCERHNQALALFCEKDLELLCPQCRVSSDHQDHPLIPMEQAAAGHRKKLKSYIEPLMNQVEDAEKGLKMQVSKLFQSRWKLENRRSKLRSEFEQFRHFLGKEQGTIHIRLLIEENRVQEKLIENKNQLSDYLSTLRSLISEITKKRLQTDLDLLTGIESLHNMYEQLETPAVFSYKLRKEICSLPPQYFGLQKTISTFQVDLTLDPQTAHHNLLISEDRKTITFQKMKPSAMSALAGLQAQANCPVCLDYLRDPVTTECGHNFCRCCIQQSWADRSDSFPCPVCRHAGQKRHLRSNMQLGRMVDIAQRLHITRSKRKRQDERHLCEKHKQVLTLFCEDDLQVLCPMCVRPPDHQGHWVRPAEEAASHHRQRLSGYIEPLEKQVANVEKLVATQERKLIELREQVQCQKQKLASEFKYLNQFVDREQEAVLSRLAEEEKDIQQMLCANITEFSDHVSTLQDLLKEVAERSVMSEVKLLTDIRSIHDRCECPKPPDLYSFQLRREGCSLPPQYLVLQKIIQRFQREVTLDPETAHPHLLVSEDKKSVTFVKKKPSIPQNPERFMMDPIILGSEGFDGGRHYWEVQLDDKSEWAVGVCEDLLSWKGKWPLSAQSRCWTIQLQNGGYVAQAAVPVTLVLKEKPREVGIYLDYELGKISFYCLNDRSHIHSFTDAFSEVLKPYFCMGQDPKPLTICAVRD
ncbi:TRI60 protein, partial [Crocuta crocuta]